MASTRGRILTLSAVFSLLPPHRPDRALGHFGGQGFEGSGHRVVPAVQVAEQGDGRDDLDNLLVVVASVSFDTPH